MKMNKLMKKGRIIFATTLLCMSSSFFSLKVSAANYAEKEPNNNTITYTYSSENTNLISKDFGAILEEPKRKVNAKAASLEEKQISKVSSTFSTDHNNHTKETAFPYSNLPEMAATDLYLLGMKSGELRTPEQEDWYTVNLTAGKRYFIDIRNMGVQDWIIEVRNYTADGGYYYWTTDKEKFNNSSERYMYIRPDTSGTHYIRIYSKGF